MVKATFDLKQAEFNDMIEQIQANPSGYNKFTTVFDPLGATGELDSHDADLSYEYREPTLTVSVVKLNSFFARHAPDSVVYGHLVEKFNDYFSK